MPAKEIKELRLGGKLAEAYSMAKAEMEAEPDNIWGKRNMSWVLYSQLDAAAADLPACLTILVELNNLALPETEAMFFENISIVIAKAARSITKEDPIDLNKLHRLFDAVKGLPIKRDCKWFDVLYSAFHKGFKDSSRYIEFADWWNFANFKPEAYQKEKLPNGREIMALAEQAYIAYAKHLLPIRSHHGEVIFDNEKAAAFLPKLHKITEDYPQFQYPAYFLAKLLLALGDNENVLSALLPFAKKKQNDFWVWQVLGEAFADDEEKEFACHCKALSCQGPEEMLVKLRQKMALVFIGKQLFNEAKTEIEQLVKARIEHEYKIPTEVTNWQSQKWYKDAVSQKSNLIFYKQYTSIAESLLFSDVPEETVIVEFVNTDKKVLNFIASETKFGFFKYDRFIREVKVGDILKVRFQGGTNAGLYKLYTVSKAIDESFKSQFSKEIEGDIRIPEGKPFGFLNDVFIHPSVVTRRKLLNGIHYKGNAIKSYNAEKKQWGWKLV